MWNGLWLERLRRCAGYGAAISAFTAMVLTGHTALADNPSDATAPSARQSSLINDWQALCLAHRADFSATVAVADASGWMVGPDALRSMFPSAIGKPAIRIRSAASGLEILLTGEINDTILEKGPQITARFCAVGSMPADPAATTAVSAVIAVPPNPSGTNASKTTYVYRHTPTGPEPILGDLHDPVVTKRLLQPGVDVIQVENVTKGTVAVLLIIQ